MIPFMFTKWLQDVFNAFLIIQIADDEKYYFKNMKFEDIYKLGFENAKDIIACGFNPQKTFIFSNRDYSNNPSYNKVFSDIMKHTSINTIQSIFGIKNNSCLGQLVWPVYQTTAAFSQSYKEIFGNQNVRCLVPYAIDQDPYFRMARQVAPKLKFMKPCSIISEFLPSLTGRSKMSSSGPKTSIYMTYSAKKIRKIINKYGFSGGGETVELHRKNGGNLDTDIAYQYLRYFEPDDKKLEQIGKDYSSGKMLSGEIKKIMADKVIELVLKHQENRKKVDDTILKLFYSFF